MEPPGQGETATPSPIDSARALEEALTVCKRVSNGNCGEDDLSSVATTLVSVCRRDFEEAKTVAVRTQLLRAVCLPLLRESYNDDDIPGRAAATALLRAVSWDLFELVLPFVSEEGRRSEFEGGGKLADGSSFPWAEKLLAEMAETCSPRELHIMALEQLPVDHTRRQLRAILLVLRRSLQRLPTTQRARFLEGTLQPVLDRLATLARPIKGKSWLGGGDDGEISDGDGGIGEGSNNDVKEEETEGMDDCPATLTFGGPSALDNAVLAGNEAAAFAGPLLEQALRERAQMKIGDTAAANQNVAGLAGLLLWALNLVLKLTPTAWQGRAGEVNSIIERLVELILCNPLFDLQYVLEQRCRLAYRAWEHAKKNSNGKEEKGAKEKRGRSGSRLGDLTVSGSLPWPSDGVAALAYLVGVAALAYLVGVAAWAYLVGVAALAYLVGVPAGP
ncbi:unnamed protein product [Discosporangium mesarthrocarpum]